MTFDTNPRDRLGRAAAILATTTFALPAFAQDVSVPYGAPKEAFIEALADMRPVDLVLQSVGSPGDDASRYIEIYGQAVEEWSGGKIVPDIVYGSAIIRGAAHPAIADGRISYGMVIAQYDPSNFPIGSALIDLTHVVNGQPFLGTLHSWGTMLETANATPEAWQEQRNYGIEPGLVLSGATPSGLFCTSPRTEPADFAGQQIRAGGLVHGAEVQGLGATAVALPFSEIYEGLQRGIAECALTSLNTAVTVGIVPLAPNYTVSQEGGFGLANVNYAFDEVFWEDLPLAGRQLLYDLQKVFIEDSIKVSFVQLADGLADIEASGGAVHELSDASKEMLRATNEQLLEESRTNSYFDDPDEVVDRVLAVSAKWDGILAELGYTEMDPGWAGFSEWFDEDSLDLTPFIDRLYQEAMLPYRPE